jgi:hypothetical protein
MKSRWLLILVLCGLAAAEEKNVLPLPHSGDVTLTLDEYNKLVELAAKPPKKNDGPPLPYSLKRAGLTFNATNGTVRGTVQVDGEVFRKGVIKVPLTSGMTIFDAHQDGKIVPLQQQNGVHTALLSGPAEFSVALDTGLPLRIEAGRASFNLPAPAAGSVQLELVIPGDRTIANISPGLITSRKSESGYTTLEATLVPGQTANIWWTTRDVVAPVAPREIRFLSELKTLVSVSEADVRVAALADITVVQGEPTQFQVELPAGYELTGVSGAALESSEVKSNILNLKVDPARSHQFLISLEKSIHETKVDAPFLSFKNAQRETGEVLVEGAGTIELTATENGGLKRMDVKETSPYLRSLAHFPPQAAFRYHRQPSETPALALEWVRFPDSGVLAAVAENAQVTTLVTSEGRSLTEVKLTLKNQAQPFLKVMLPAGANIVSADVAGERVKPVQGPDGNRVPLLRPGFRPTGTYTVSFVFMHSGAPFAKKGGAELSLPNMDIPINLLQWEVFLPERYKVKDFGGDVISADLVPTALVENTSMAYGYPAAAPGVFAPAARTFGTFAGQVTGVVTDPSGAVVPNARVTLTRAETGFSVSTTSDQNGNWMFSNVPAGEAKLKADANGFKSTTFNVNYDASRGATYNIPLNIGNVSESVEVTAEAPVLNETSSATLGGPINGRNVFDLAQLQSKKQAQPASSNVMNLQKRVAGVLPVPIDVPHAGTSFSFVRPLVLDEETKVTFSYKSR